MTPITVYTKNACIQCKMTKKYLDRLGAVYNSINIEEDDEAKTHVVKDLGFLNVPVVEAEGFEPFFGFRKERLESIVNNSK